MAAWLTEVTSLVDPLTSAKQWPRTQMGMAQAPQQWSFVGREAGCVQVCWSSPTARRRRCLGFLLRSKLVGAVNPGDTPALVAWGISKVSGRMRQVLISIRRTPGTSHLSRGGLAITIHILSAEQLFQGSDTLWVAVSFRGKSVLPNRKTAVYYNIVPSNLLIIQQYECQIKQQV